jgi:hypothetical protein
VNVGKNYKVNVRREREFFGTLSFSKQVRRIIRISAEEGFGHSGYKDSKAL